ncbi:hypothetical protein BDR07DRAFT_1383082 [Suillus spraguei]|nr:hypothetical protein BDR07DRAFT_1383082 [Suillus spraguei]
MALQNQLNKMSINLTTAPSAASINNIYTRVPAVFNQQNQQQTYSHQPATMQQPFMITEEMKTAVKQLIQAMLHQQDNTTGQTAYAAQLAQWNAKWGESIMDKTAHYQDHTEILMCKDYPISLIMNSNYEAQGAWIEEIMEQQGKVDSLEDTQAEVKVLTCKEAASKDKDRIYGPKVSAGHVARNIAFRHPHIKKPQLENGEVILFIHQIELEGPKRELVQVQVLFDNGAMTTQLESIG